MKKIEPVELDFCDRQQLLNFQKELALAAAGQISAEWIRRSFDALSPEVKKIFGEVAPRPTRV